MRILLVDDDPNALEMQQGLIELAGHQVVTAATGQSALAFIDTQAFDAAFIDIVLPDSDGFDILRHLTGKQPEARAFVLSAHDRPENVDRALRLGARALLAKPLRWSELRGVLDAASGCLVPGNSVA